MTLIIEMTLIISFQSVKGCYQLFRTMIPFIIIFLNIFSSRSCVTQIIQTSFSFYYMYLLQVAANQLKEWILNLLPHPKIC